MAGTDTSTLSAVALESIHKLAQICRDRDQAMKAVCVVRSRREKGRKAVGPADFKAAREMLSEEAKDTKRLLEDDAVQGMKENKKLKKDPR